jgi:hypothetical protein
MADGNGGVWFDRDSMLVECGKVVPGVRCVHCISIR